MYPQRIHDVTSASRPFTVDVCVSLSFSLPLAGRQDIIHCEAGAIGAAGHSPGDGNLMHDSAGAAPPFGSGVPGG